MLADETFDSIPGIYFNFGKDGSILRANKALSSSCRMDQEKLLGRKVAEIFSEGFWKEIESRLHATGQSTVEFEFSSNLGEKNRDYLWQISAIERLAKQGKEVYSCTGRDLTEIKQAHAKVLEFAKNLEITAQVQGLLLPERHDYKGQKVEIAATYKPAESASGDYWRFETLDAERSWIILADVTGHGVGPAMVTAMVAGCIQTHLSAKKKSLNSVDMPSLVQSVHDRLRDLRGNPYWMTFLGAEIDTKASVIRWWSAAAPPLIIIGPNGEVDHPDFKPSSPLGNEKFNTSCGEIPFPKGSRVVALTDGILEAENRLGRQFGLRMTSKILADTKTSSAAAARDMLLKEVIAWEDGAPAKDDCTFIIVDHL